jgi:hypothetical protein
MIWKYKGNKEHEAGQREEGKGDCSASGGETQIREQLHVEHRVRPAAFDDDQGGERNSGGDETADRARASPATVGSFDNRVDEADQGQRGRRESADVKRAASVGAIRRNEQNRADHGEGRDRDHGQEDAAPPVVGQQCAADDRSDRNRDPVTAPHAPIALARVARSAKVWLMIDKVVGKMNSAAAPITSRHAISDPVLLAVAATALPRLKTARPAARVRRRAKRSPIVPPVRISPAKATL